MRQVSTITALGSKPVTPAFSSGSAVWQGQQNWAPVAGATLVSLAAPTTAVSIAPALGLLRRAARNKQAQTHNLILARSAFSEEACTLGAIVAPSRAVIASGLLCRFPAWNLGWASALVAYRTHSHGRGKLLACCPLLPTLEHNVCFFTTPALRCSVPPLCTAPPLAFTFHVPKPAARCFATCTRLSVKHINPPRLQAGVYNTCSRLILVLTHFQALARHLTFHSLLTSRCDAHCTRFHTSSPSFGTLLTQHVLRAPFEIHLGCLL